MALIGVVFSLIVNPITWTNVIITVCIWVALSKGNGLIVHLLNQRISWVDQPVLRLIIGMIAMLVYTVVAFGFILAIANWWVVGTNPLEMALRLSISEYIIAILITLIISMFLHGRDFYLNWKEALYREERLKSESLKSRYESLKNQVNPHFLFNSLNVLTSLVYEDQERAVEFIRKLSSVYRYVLEHKDAEIVSLEDELAFLKNYAYLQHIRFGDNFQLDVTGEASGYVAPLAIQLLVENAIKHNVVSEARPLKVEVTLSEKAVCVKNNIQEKLSKDSTGIGLSNLQARYQYLSDTPVTIENDGKLFAVTVPVLQHQTPQKTL